MQLATCNLQLASPGPHSDRLSPCQSLSSVSPLAQRVCPTTQRLEHPSTVDGLLLSLLLASIDLSFMVQTFVPVQNYNYIQENSCTYLCKLRAFPIHSGDSFGLRFAGRAPETYHTRVETFQGLTFPVKSGPHSLPYCRFNTNE